MADENVLGLTDEQRKLFSLPSQVEANYSPAGGGMGKACSNCRFFLVSDYSGKDRCHLIDNWPEPIVPNGVCDRHEVKRETPIEEIVPVPVVIVEPEFDEGDSDMMEMSWHVPKSLKDRIVEFVDSLRSKANKDDAFTVFKTASGKKAWVARFSGKWIDRESEIIADKAHDEYVKRVQTGVVPAPELWMWHLKGTKHGQAVTVWKSGGFVLATGYFDDTPEGESAYRYYQKQRGKIKLSHMFHYPKSSKIGNVYYDYNTVEITTLPDGAEAFPFTTFEEIQAMAIPDAARSMISEALGDEALRRAEAHDKSAENDSKSLDDLGIASKGLDKYEGSETVISAAKLTDVETRLKVAEDALKGVGDLTAAVTQMSAQLKQMGELLQASEDAKAQTLEKVNALEQQLAEYRDLKPPASQSNDTLLSDREKSLVERVVTASKSEDQMSLIEKLVGGQPAVASS